MKSFRGRLITKIKSISIVTSLKPNISVLQYLQSPPILPKECDGQDHNKSNGTPLLSYDHHQLVDEFKDAKEEPEEEEEETEDNENEEIKKTLQFTRSDDVVSSLSLSDKVGLLSEPAANLQKKTVKIEKIPDSIPQINEGEKEFDQNFPLLKDFEEKCPPGGSESVVFYTTSFRGIRKTFEDCSSIRFLLESFGIIYDERDISLHLEYREELWSIMGKKLVPPRLFIRGRHIGGADEVVGLHEQGFLKKLLKGIPMKTPANRSCSGCDGVRFVLCLKCNGSRKITPIGRRDGGGCGEGPIRCLDCNENGLVKCPICSSLI